MNRYSHFTDEKTDSEGKMLSQGMEEQVLKTSLLTPSPEFFPV